MRWDYETFRIVRNIPPPPVESSGGSLMAALVELANTMTVGEAAVLSLSQAQQFRLILAGMGFACVTDGWRCDTRGKTLAFKLHIPDASSVEWSNWEI